MRLLRSFLETPLAELHENRIRLNAIGELNRLPPVIQRKLNRVIKETASYNNGVLTLALSYGGRAEIVAAAREIATQVHDGRLNLDDINEETFSRCLYTHDIPDPDLLIRTAAEMRLSNFLLWQVSYSELWVTPTLWPDFNEETLRHAVQDYSRRVRRFGEIK